jgi:UPF0716 protein FxsA
MPLIPIFLLLFISIPLIEIYLFIQVGSMIGALPTVLVVVLTAVLGVFLLRAQGMSTWLRLNRELAAGRLPAVEMLEGAVLLICGALLLTPGFFTDTVGFLLLMPPLRRALIRLFLARANWVMVMRTRGQTGSSQSSQRSKDEHTIEGEYWRDDKKSD